MNTMKRGGKVFLLLLGCFISLSSLAYAGYGDPAGSNLAIFISGISGGEKYQSPFNTAAQLLGKVLSANGFSAETMYRFSENADPMREWGKNDFSRKEILRNFMIHAANPPKPYDTVFIFIAGHANGRDEEAKLHLPGEDVDYQTLIGWIDAIPARRMIVVLAASQGHVWISKLGKPGRVLIIGNAMREFDFMPITFLRFFPYAFWPAEVPEKETERATEKSLTDIFVETQRKVKNWYRVNELTATEQAWLDADGDGKGMSLFLPEPASSAPGAGGKAGALQASEVKVDIFSPDFLKQRYPMDETLPDAVAGRKILFSIPGGESHGTH